MGPLGLRLLCNKDSLHSEKNPSHGVRGVDVPLCLEGNHDKLSCILFSSLHFYFSAFIPSYLVSLKIYQ
ncbi:hypothetical protein MtrunA17_Chr2g0306761 [Medicago truncatula]|uniref:Uncharacterized protein n=1 Tax=Medicago truncatula TaxID=3880 RepID=A0A396J7F1_MEDTR|nr:hypothetical protein MtrunA17_Chr2g0306761 [Medicago truncatula]